MRFVTGISLGLLTVLSACGQPMMQSVGMPAAVGAQSAKVVKATSKVLLLASFATLDKNADKSVDRGEFVTMTGLPFELVDLNRDGNVSAEEFTSDVTVGTFARSLRRIASGVGRALDTDKDKQVSVSEFLASFSKTDSNALALAKTAFAGHDRRHDGKLGMSEFEDLYMAMYTNGALSPLPGPMYPVPKPPAPKPGNGGGAPAPTPGNGGPAPAPGNGGPAPTPGNAGPAPVTAPPVAAPPKSLK